MFGLDSFDTWLTWFLLFSPHPEHEGQNIKTFWRYLELQSRDMRVK